MIYEALLNYDNDVVIKGNRCITIPQELYQALTHKDTSETWMHRDFAETFFTSSGLSNFVQNVQTVNPHCTIAVDTDVRDFRLRAIKALESYTSIEKVIFQLQAHPREMTEVIRILRENYTDTYSETLVANNKVSALQLQNSELIRKLEDAREDSQRILQDKSMVEAQLDTLVGHINYSYEKDINPTQFIQTKGKSRFMYTLYIKECTRVRYVDMLLYYLKEILKMLYEVSVREVAIGPYYSYGGIRLYEGMQSSSDLSHSQLYQPDTYMPGFQSGAMADILKNPSNVKYLIVLDRCGLEVLHIAGDEVEYVYTMSNPNDNHDRIGARHTISYSHNSLYIPYIEGLEGLSVEDRMVRYSSTKIVKHLIESLEHGQEGNHA